MGGDFRGVRGHGGAGPASTGTGSRTTRGPVGATTRPTPRPTPRTTVRETARDLTARHAGLVALAACVGIWLVTSGSREPVGPPLPSPAEALTATSATGPGIAPLPGSPPSRIRIPSIRVDAPLIGLGLERDRSLEVPPPARGDLAGWYREGTTPGATGTAVIAGHVDHATGPAVFYHLGALRRGAAIEIPRADGRTAVFTVHAVEVYGTEAFPDSRVYGPSARAELRVITCGGGFSPRTGYRGNVVVFAHLTGTY